MDESFFDLMEFLKRPSITETLVDILLCAVPIWLAVMIGLLIGWSWRPRWTGLVFLGLRSKFRFIWTAPPGFGARRLWLAFTALSAFSACRAIWNNFKRKDRESAPAASAPALAGNTAAISSGEEGGVDISPSAGSVEIQQDVVTENDLEHLLQLLEGKDGEVEWQHMMERSTPNMAYQAWRHEPEALQFTVVELSLRALLQSW